MQTQVKHSEADGGLRGVVGGGAELYGHPPPTTPQCVICSVIYSIKCVFLVFHFIYIYIYIYICDYIYIFIYMCVSLYKIPCLVLHSHAPQLGNPQLVGNLQLAGAERVTFGGDSLRLHLRWRSSGTPSATDAAEPWPWPGWPSGTIPWWLPSDKLEESPLDMT